jgi:hypothetical protein
MQLLQLLMLLYGLPAYEIAKLQRVQNAAAIGLDCMVPQIAHISPYLMAIYFIGYTGYI